MIFGGEKEVVCGVFLNSGDCVIQKDCPVFITEKGYSNVPSNCFIGICNDAVESGKHGLYQCYGVRELSYKHKLLDSCREVYVLKDNIVFIKAL